MKSFISINIIIFSSLFLKTFLTNFFGGEIPIFDFLWKVTLLCRYIQRFLKSGTLFQIISRWNQRNTGSFCSIVCKQYKCKQTIYRLNRYISPQCLSHLYSRIKSSVNQMRINKHIFSPVKIKDKIKSSTKSVVEQSGHQRTRKKSSFLMHPK